MQICGIIFFLILQLHRDVMDYLKFRAKGETPDKVNINLDREEAAIKESYINMISDRSQKLSDLELKIRLKKKDNQELNNRIVALNIEVSAGSICRKTEDEDNYIANTNKR